ncbi:MAG: amylo-alpha-1,6-glucosidase [Myxococcota bacterium]
MSGVISGAALDERGVLLEDVRVDSATEWLEADGLGGFASGTTSGLRTRRYHALLLAAARPPTDRFVLVNGFVAWLESKHGVEELVPQHYAPGITTEPPAQVVEFSTEPWPSVRYKTQSGIELLQEIIVERGSATVLVRFRLLTKIAAKLRVRPLLSGRDFHQLHRENQSFAFTPNIDGQALTWTPYPGVPSIHVWSNGNYRHAPDWYRNFRYTEEMARGLDCDEDLATPGEFQFDLSEPALWLLSAGVAGGPAWRDDSAAVYVDDLLRRERARRESQPNALLRASEAYLVERGDGRTIIAGYPWFSDWGRDTFIALRGLCLASGRLLEARKILLEWSSVVSQGMLPNRFPDASGAEPEYNSVDASLWYVIAAREFLARAGHALVDDAERRAIENAMREIVFGYANGTRFGIRRDSDGLLSAGAPLCQLTWMDAKVGDHVVTPRSGKPVEVQALWLNALHAARELHPRFGEWLEVGERSFGLRFWNAELEALFDVVDVNHEAGVADDALRPNQIFAAGGLPYTPLPAWQARKVVDIVERELWTPMGLRSLAPGSAGYRPRYDGDVWSRDTAYHQGTVWPWLLGPFVEAWLKTRGGGTVAKHEARVRFVLPLHTHLREAGLGHISEIADAETPFAPRGCPFQAWSVAELLRLEFDVLAE